MAEPAQAPVLWHIQCDSLEACETHVHFATATSEKDQSLVLGLAQLPCVLLPPAGTCDLAGRRTSMWISSDKQPPPSPRGASTQTQGVLPLPLPLPGMPAWAPRRATSQVWPGQRSHADTDHILRLECCILESKLPQRDTRFAQQRSCDHSGA